MSEPTTESTTHQPEIIEFKAEMKQLLHLIIHSLYTHEEIFLRELISNASDALNKIRFRMLTDRDVIDSGADLRIDVKLDKNAHTLTISDTGIGMSREELVSRIGTVASSGTLDFVSELKKKDGPVDAHLIGRFGVGFYSAFMVAEKIVVDTRAADPESEAVRWESDGGGTYTIEASDRTSRGTTIKLFLKQDKKEFEEEWRVKQVIRKYSNFVDFPIHVDGEKVNTVEALWHKGKSEITDEERTEFYKFITSDMEEPLGHLHLSIEGKVNFRALLFFPKKAPRDLFREDYEHGVHLYSSNVFIQDDCKSLLPDYLKFVRGVVDTEDLPLNVSREVTQHSPVMAKIRQIVTTKLLDQLSEWAADDVERYENFFREFGTLFKTGLSSDFENREKLIDLMRFESSALEAGKLTSFSQYVDRMQPEQDEIYYVLADSRLGAERNPNLEYFRANDMEVLFMTDPVDSFIVPGIPKVKEHTLQSVEKADLKLKKQKESKGLGKQDTKKLVERFKSVLGSRVEDVRASDRLVESAATLVVGKQGMDTQMERMMRMMDEKFEGSKRVLEINTAHALIKNLSALRVEAGKDALVESAILQIFEGALLAEGSLRSPQDYVARMTELMVAATGGAEKGEAPESPEGSSPEKEGTDSDS